MNEKIVKTKNKTGEAQFGIVCDIKKQQLDDGTPAYSSLDTSAGDQ